MDFSKKSFYSPSKGKLSLDGVAEEISAYMSEKPDRHYEIIVGCDSSSAEEPVFPVVAVVLRKGEGGRFFIRKIKYFSGKKFYSLKQRILEEVLISCETALALREKVAEKAPGRYEFRYIHADIGENGKTKDMIKEVAGLIRGNGFEPKIKPESYAASAVADRYC